MYYLLYLTERCNLDCAYCESRSSRSSRLQDPNYDMDRLVEFFNADPDLELQLYGGEPLLRIPFIDELLGQVKPRRVCIQTNAFLLGQIPDHLLDRIDVLCVSIDGPADITDRGRGAGVYERAVAEATALRARGFRGAIDVRMTTSPGVEIYKTVRHFLHDCDFRFDSIYWQLNVLFGELDWRWDKKFISRWFRTTYNPQITQLIDEWVDTMEREHRLQKIIPFAGIMNTLLTGRPVEQIQCGAGYGSWTITPTGDVYPCPVMRESPQYLVGNIRELEPSDISPTKGLRGPCQECEVLTVCGGRCIYTSESMRWGQEGFELVCDSVKHLISELERVKPRVQAVIDAGHLKVEEYSDVGYDYEVIP